jgi:YggT family protein
VLGNLFLLIVGAVLGFFSVLLLVRVLMQWARASFRNQIGHFVTALTDWAVVPLRRVVPGWFGLDLASLLLALAAETLLVLAELTVRGYGFGAGAGAFLAILGLGGVETLRLAVYVVIGVVLIAAVMSWVNPHSAYAPLFDALARPFLAPLRRFIPPIANIDLSPLVLLLLLQVVLMLLASARAGLVPYLV